MTGFVTTYRLTGAAVQAILNRVFDQATADDRRIFVAVVDHTGELAGLLAHDGTPPICRQIAADKAFTALATRGRTSAWKAFVFGSPVEERELMLSRPRYVAAAGGCPIVINGEVVGGVGVSGASQEVDEALAELGAAVPLQL
jgi:glc operon protein GlcG